MWSEEPTAAARQTTWHSINIDFFFMIAGGLSGLHTHSAALLAAIVMPLCHDQLESVWAATTTLRGPLQLAGAGGGGGGDGSGGDGSGGGGDSWVPVYPPTPLISIYFRIVPVLGMLFIALAQELAQRQEFRYRRLLQHAKNTRIEQLPVSYTHLTLPTTPYV